MFVLTIFDISVLGKAEFWFGSFHIDDLTPEKIGI